jgi:hypothetical protein
LSGNSLTLTGPGLVTVRAQQPGNPDFLAAPPVERSFTSLRANATITFNGLSTTYDGSVKPVTASTDPPGLYVKLTYDGVPVPPSASGSYQVDALIEDDLYQGQATSTLVIAPRSFPEPLTGWLATNSTTVAGADTASPLLNSGNGSGSSGPSVSFFARTTPRTLTTVGDSLHLSGTVTVNTPGGLSFQGRWFRFGLYENPNAAGSLTVNNWRGYTAMAQASATGSLYERIGTGEFASSINGASSRQPDASPPYVGANSPSGVLTLRVEQSITRTATGVRVVSRLAKPGTGGAPDTVYLSSTHSDSTPNNNGLLPGSSQTTAIDYSPRYDTVGFVLSGEYLNSSNTSSVQFQNMEIAYSPGTDAAPQTIAFPPMADATFGDPPIDLAPAASASSGLPVSFAVISGPATLNGTMLTLTGTGVVTLRASQPGDYSYLPATPVEQTLTVIEPTYTNLETWRHQHFGTYENAGTAADSFDANSDGEPNLLEFATAQDPHAATRAMTAVTDSTGPGHLFTYTRNKAALPEISFIVEHSDTLETAGWSTSGVTEISPPSFDDGVIQTVNVEVPDGTTKHFYRLRIVSQP